MSWKSGLFLFSLAVCIYGSLFFFLLSDPSSCGGGWVASYHLSSLKSSQFLLIPSVSHRLTIFSSPLSQSSDPAATSFCFGHLQLWTPLPLLPLIFCGFLSWLSPFLCYFQPCVRATGCLWCKSLSDFIHYKIHFLLNSSAFFSTKQSYFSLLISSITCIFFFSVQSLPICSSIFFDSLGHYFNPVSIGGRGWMCKHIFQKCTI